MLLRPSKRDYAAIFYYTGQIIGGFALTMLVPIITAACFREWNVLFSFLIGISLCGLFWLATDRFFYTEKELSWFTGMLVVALSWTLAVTFGAVPMRLSGFYSSFVDATFDMMSGFTTTGLTLIQDLDHAPYSIHMWRQGLQYLGGQGIIVLALTFMIRNLRGALKIYVGEGKDEKLVPSVHRTARAIWVISLVYLALGTAALAGLNLASGMAPARAFLHGLWISMAAWSTGGYAPSTLNTAYYHSFLVELVVVWIMVLGSFNFIIHQAVWHGQRRELLKNIEVRTSTIVTTIMFALAFFGLTELGTYSSFFGRFRMALFHVISAETTTGAMSVPPAALQYYWGDLGTMALILAMAIGGYACSTAGGIKAMRVGLAVKGIVLEVRKLLSPEKSVVVEKYHHIRDLVLEDNQLKMVGLITLAYVSTYVFGALVGLGYGYPLLSSLFESVSAAANAGLSMGITSPSMPVVMKLLYILEMWVGRLEFTAVFVLAGFLVTLVRGK